MKEIPDYSVWHSNLSCSMAPQFGHLLWFKRLTLLDSWKSRQVLEFLAGTDIEQFHLKFLKWCLGVHSKTTYVAVWGTLVDIPSYSSRLKACVRLLWQTWIPFRDGYWQRSLIVKAFEDQKHYNLGWYESITKLRNHYRSPKTSQRSNSSLQSHRISETTNAMINIRSEFENTAPKMNKLDFP